MSDIVWLLQNINATFVLPQTIPCRYLCEVCQVHSRDAAHTRQMQPFQTIHQTPPAAKCVIYCKLTMFSENLIVAKFGNQSN